jgi:hypothetical protein
VFTAPEAVFLRGRTKARESSAEQAVTTTATTTTSTTFFVEKASERQQEPENQDGFSAESFLSLRNNFTLKFSWLRI